jgi:hypothetical protein
MTALALARIPALPPVTPRVGSPRRAAILTALAAAAVRDGNLKAVLVLARTGRPRSLFTCAGGFRWLAMAGLKAVYPDANDAALRAALGCRPSRDNRPRAALREIWPDDAVEAVARAVVENEDAQLTASWVWPEACAIAAAHTGAPVQAVQTPPGTRGCQPHAISSARKLAVYLTMTEGDVNATAMAAATGLDKSTVRHAVDQLADRRDDDPQLDETLETLTTQLRQRLDEDLGQW